jgi:tetratricopeptide (TPR) repeat protein
MRQIIYNILLINYSVIVISCASQEVRIQTTPAEAKVVVSNPNGESQDLGQTPVRVSSADIKLKAPFFIEISKDGYFSKSIFIPHLNPNTELKAQVTLDPKSDLGSMTTFNTTDGNTLVKEISSIHNHISKKEFLEAQNRLLNLTSKYSGYSALWSLLGNVYYLQRKWDSALESYSKAYDLDPSAIEIKSMIDRVKALKGGG